MYLIKIRYQNTPKNSRAFVLIEKCLKENSQNVLSNRPINRYRDTKKTKNKSEKFNWNEKKTTAFKKRRPEISESCYHHVVEQPLRLVRKVSRHKNVVLFSLVSCKDRFILIHECRVLVFQFFPKTVCCFVFIGILKHMK
jgi:hypothetical protein